MSIPYSRYVIGSIPWYSVLIVSGVIAAIALCLREEKRMRLPADTMIDLALWAIPSGVIGARLYYVIFQWPMFAQDPLSILRIWEGGLAIYGAVIGGFLAVMLFSKRKRISPFSLTDIIVPGLALAQCIGRWGNYFNMEAYGQEITDSNWQFFPIGVQILSGNEYRWHMATFFYESCWNLAVFLSLWFVIRKRRRYTGQITLWYLLLYGIGRTLIEGLRTDSLMSGNVRVSQLLSIALICIAASILLFKAICRKRPPAKE